MIAWCVELGNSEDFAVRSVGLPDIGPLVGIWFGKVVTLISPDALTANWQEIAWHEFMHVITLQMTDNRMPRWLGRSSPSRTCVMKMQFVETRTAGSPEFRP